MGSADWTAMEWMTRCHFVGVVKIVPYKHSPVRSVICSRAALHANVGGTLPACIPYAVRGASQAAY